MSIVSPGFFLGTINLWDLLMFFFHQLVENGGLDPKKDWILGCPISGSQPHEKIDGNYGFQHPLIHWFHAKLLKHGTPPSH